MHDRRADNRAMTCPVTPMTKTRSETDSANGNALGSAEGQPQTRAGVEVHAFRKS